MTHPIIPRSIRQIVTLLLLLPFAGGCGDDAPTGVSREALEGTWSGSFSNVSLLGRTLSGDLDWQFTKDRFEIRFFDPPSTQSERIGGDWKFEDERLVVTLTTSFPVEADLGATDTIFVSILNSEMSVRTGGGSSFILTKTSSVSLPSRNSYYLCRFTVPRERGRCASRGPRSPKDGLFCRTSKRVRPLKLASLTA